MLTLIVDDHRLIGEGIQLLLQTAIPGTDAHCVSSGEAAIELARERAFDLVLLDWRLPAEPSGAALVAALRDVLPQCRLVVVSGDAQASTIRAAIDAGACGFVPKESNAALLLAALTVTANGGIYLPAAALQGPDARSDAGHGMRRIEEAYPALTPRQADVLGAAAIGLSNKEIARKLGISDNTVKQHLSVVFRELQVTSRTEAVFALSQAGVRIA